MDKKIYIDEKWVAPADAKVSVFDHGLLYGDGVFEGIRAYEGRAFRLKQHLERLYQSAEFISLKIPMTLSKLSSLVDEALRVNKLKEAYIRLIVTRGVGDLGLDPRKCGKPNVIIIADQVALFPERCYKEGLEAVFVKTTRNLIEALNPAVKSLNYLNSILAKIEANNANVPEGIMLNHEGYVAECTGDNVFFIKGKNIVTPPTQAGVLVGITRAAVMEIIAEKTPYEFSEKLFKRDELMAADEIFFTGTAAEVIPVTKIDNQKIGKGVPGPITLELINHFKDLTKKEALASAR
jgi:branched-chain amino acid aminotransferase